MMIGPELILEQQIKLNQRQLLSMKLLALPMQNLHEFIQEKIVENPLLELDDSFSKEKNSYSDERFWEQIPDQSRSFESVLLQELRMHISSTRLYEAAKLIVCSLDTRGFFLGDLAKLGEIGGFSSDEMKRALAVVRACEPFGVGASSVQESLLIQLPHQTNVPEGTEMIIKKYFSEFLHSKWDVIERKSGLSFKEVKAVRDFIKKMSPYPAHQFMDNVQYIHPEVEIISLEKGKLGIRFLEELPSLIYRSDLYELYNNTEDKEIRSFLLKHKKNYLILQEALVYRRMSIMKVIQYILQVQKHFFLQYGDIKPLLQKDISLATGLSASTVSRVCHERYVLFKGKIYAVQDFLGRAYVCGAKKKEPVSDKFVMQQLKNLIQGEDKLRPLSDQEICSVLEKYKISISRRTVTKLRLKLNIPNSSMRRRQYLL